jgi:hypothetical protein
LDRFGYLRLQCVAANIMDHDFETGLSSQMQIASTVAVGTHAQTVLSQ